MKISVCMIVRNESDHLPRALESIPESYERIVLDTGSTDNTVQIAESMGARVYRWEWMDDFSAARNESISHATGDHILILDADERLAEDTVEQMTDFVRHYPDRPAIVTIWNQMDEGEVSRSRMVRFFPRLPQFRFEGIVHERLMDGHEPAEALASEIRLLHHGYEKENYDRKGKEERYLRLYALQLEREPRNGYLLYQIGKLHHSMQRYEKACEYFCRCIEIGEQERLYYPPMLVMYGYALKNLNRSGEAEALLTPFLSAYPTFPDLPFLLGLLAMDTKKVLDIERHFLKALEIGETTQYTTVEGVGSYKAAYNVGLYYELTGQADKARTAYDIAASFQYGPAIQRLMQLKPHPFTNP